MTVAVAAREPALALLAEPALDRLAVRHREVRDAQLAERQLEVDHLGDPAGVPERLALVREERGHLGRATSARSRASRTSSGPACRGCCRCRRRAGRRGPRPGARGRSGGRWSTTSGRPASGARRSSCSFSRRCSGRPWSWSSRKKLPLPKMSPYSPASRRAELPVVGLERPRDLAAEAGRQADEALACRARCSRSIRGL